MEKYREKRELMVRRQLRGRGIDDEKVLQAFLDIPRHLFVPLKQRPFAYEDCPLPIGLGQTISQPYMVALMTLILQPQKDDTVLEIGTGSGYQAAILSRLVREVISIERIALLSRRAGKALAQAGVNNVRLFCGDGSAGWRTEKLYDRIIVTAGAPGLAPEFGDLLAEGGRLVIPIGTETMQELYLYVKEEGELTPYPRGGCRFVKLVGKGGW
jgi:protein-L-isoaspartate(D-aspartate) O-methyltransferase